MRTFIVAHRCCETAAISAISCGVQRRATAEGFQRQYAVLCRHGIAPTGGGWGRGGLKVE
jgi:hypothetical protein